ncbi:MAG: FAD-dependent oxidoreductase [Methylococcaceae bacterium]|nr:FAD-dependent oxidoreductase [Methylococcaceae bacterium]
MTQTTEITIIGSGIIGLLTAREFLQAGYSITLIDKSLSGQESSWAGGGILLPLYPWRQEKAISTLVIKSISNYSTLSNELYNSTQINPEWYDCGLLICKNPDIELATNWCTTYQIPFQETIPSFINNFNTKTKNPLWMPTIAQARNPRLLKSLKVYLLNAGVKFIENSEVINCELKNNNINTLSTNKEKIKVNQLIISTGAWTGKLAKQLLPTSLHSPEIHPVKGQMLLFNANPDTLPHMVLDNDHYLIPRRDGKILVGSSVEHSAFDKCTTKETKEKLFTFATELFPILKNFPLCNHWAGLRPGTKKGIPYIDKHPEIKNLAINAGHFRNGLVMGPASAQLIADLILDRTPCVDPAPYHL